METAAVDVQFQNCPFTLNNMLKEDDLGVDEMKSDWDLVDNSPIADINAECVSGTTVSCKEPAMGESSSSTLLPLVSKESKKVKKVRKKRLPGERTVYQCDSCPKVYPSAGGLKYHRLIFHNKQYTPPVCEICGKIFRLQKYLDTHKHVVHFKRKDHLCDLCGKEFSSKFGLKLHTMGHAGEKNFRCDVCGMLFNTIGKVNTHKLVHGGPKRYVCEKCSRAFRWKKSLLTHMRTHSGERPFQCEHCGKKFAASWNMQQHVRLHTGERPYVCDVCGKTFALNASLKEHRAKHHPLSVPVAK